MAQNKKVLRCAAPGKKQASLRVTGKRCQSQWNDAQHQSLMTAARRLDSTALEMRYLWYIVTACLSLQAQLLKKCPLIVFSSCLFAMFL